MNKWLNPVRSKLLALACFNKKAIRFQQMAMYLFLLPRQGSNLDSSDPESDVLPITPRGKSACKSNKVYVLFK
jgi:hypothetical protein